MGLPPLMGLDDSLLPTDVPRSEQPAGAVRNIKSEMYLAVGISVSSVSLLLAYLVATTHHICSTNFALPLSDCGSDVLTLVSITDYIRRLSRWKAFRAIC
ncbi:TPA: hypothetical protein ACH3X1_009422 [Trebouxia sp. C0004]